MTTTPPPATLTAPEALQAVSDAAQAYQAARAARTATVIAATTVPGVTHQTIADAAGLSRRRVTDLAADTPAACMVVADAADDSSYDAGDAMDPHRLRMRVARAAGIALADTAAETDPLGRVTITAPSWPRAMDGLRALWAVGYIAHDTSPASPAAGGPRLRVDGLAPRRTNTSRTI